MCSRRQEGSYFQGARCLWEEAVLSTENPAEERLTLWGKGVVPSFQKGNISAGFYENKGRV
jgi:hypothetical protein